MAMILSEEMEMLRDSARGFLQSAAPISQLRQLRDSNNEDGFDRQTWQDMAELGWLSVLIPEAYGGAELGAEAAGVLAEEMGRTLTASPFLSSAVMGATAVNRYGSEAQKAEWLPQIGEGRSIFALASDENRHHAPHHIATTATASGNGFSISGEKSFVLDAGVADMLIVAARTAGETTEKDGITLFLVPTTSDGIKMERRAMVDSRHVGRVRFDQVTVDGDAVLGEVGQGYGALETILNTARACLAAEMSGSAQECFERSVEYLKEREQFGQKIGSFQGLQHRAGHLYAEVALGRSIVMQALRMVDAAPDQAAMLVSAAKAKLGEVSLLAAQEGVQMHGGIGMTDEFDIGFFLKRVRVADATFGDRHFHTERFAQIRGY